MRLGAPVFVQTKDWAALAREHRRLGYGAAYCPEGLSLDDLSEVRAARQAFAQEGVVLAEVGAWCNVLDPDAAKASANRRYVAERLALADELGARCCVNILGSFRPDRWDGPFPEAYSQAFFDESVAAYREILDAARPKRTFMTFETMPYYFLDGPEMYAALLRAIGRPGAAAHVDLCNCVNSPRRLYSSAALAEDTFRILGPYIQSVHLKDLDLVQDGPPTAQFQEVLAGTGQMDLAALLRASAALPDLPVMLEHLPDEDSYLAARDNVLHIAQNAGLSFEN